MNVMYDSLYAFLLLIPVAITFCLDNLGYAIQPHATTLDHNIPQKFSNISEYGKYNLGDWNKRDVALLESFFPSRSRDSEVSMSSKSCVKKEDSILLLHTQFGLSNRLRALSSGVTFARQYGFSLRVIWEKDKHLEACIEDVLDVNKSNLQDTHCEFNLATVDPVNYVIINHMDPLFPDERFKEIPSQIGTLHGSKRHLYVKTGFRFMTSAAHCQFSDEDEQQSIGTFVPNLGIKDLVDQVIFPDDCLERVGMHIRQRDPMTELGPSTATASYSSASIQMLKDAFLHHNKIQKFQRKILDIVAQGGGTNRTCFFLAIDDRMLLSKVHVPSPNIIKFLPRDCDDRGSDCVKYAFADLLSLSLCDKIYGSFWSSFTEMAGRMGKTKSLVLSLNF